MSPAQYIGRLFGVEMQVLSFVEVDQVAAAGGFQDAMGYTAIAMGAAAGVSGGLACVPTPATPALAAFAALTSLLGAGAAYLAMQ